MRFITLILFLLFSTLTSMAQKPASLTEGVITNEFVDEATMKADLLQMLADFSLYMSNDWQECEQPNALDEPCGAFKGEEIMANTERGVRPNADLSMICAFLARYGKPAGVVLPEGVTWQKIEEMAMKSLVFAYSTHKANKLKPCAKGKYWGSVSSNDFSWESSLWAMSVAYSAYFQWEKLNDTQRMAIYKMLKAECNYELERSIPTGFKGDTKAEENGWEADVLAVTLGLFPDDELAPKWFGRLREFAINSYSHEIDMNNRTIVDPSYDNTTVAELYKGANLYSDYSLQNHNLFHTSYQNVVMQELGEAALALRLFGNDRWKTNALLHNCRAVQDSILNWLALADGELAMPNGNDWSLFLYDQITSYSTMACFMADADALMMENLAYKQIKARQKTTKDGSWLLHPDVGARRMGVQAHRVMMTYLMHEVMPTSGITPTKWNDFRNRYSDARLIKEQNVVRAYTPWKFSCFSWSEGIRSYTGYFTSDKPDKNKVVVPYRANNTGNILGWYEVEKRRTNAVPARPATYQFDGNAYVINGELLTNDSALTHRFAIYSTPGKALAYIDYVTANADCTIKKEKGGLLAISTDALTSLERDLKQGEGWANIDEEISVISKGNGTSSIYFGDRTLDNSIYTTKLYPLYNNVSRSFSKGERVGARTLIYYTDTSADATKQLAEAAKPLQRQLPEGWNGILFTDNGVQYMFVSNFCGKPKAKVLGHKIRLNQAESIIIPLK